jgi:hypothetical protein
MSAAPCGAGIDHIDAHGGFVDLVVDAEDVLVPEPISGVAGLPASLRISILFVSCATFAKTLSASDHATFWPPT